MKWFDFITYGEIKSPAIKIPVKQYGIESVVIVRTKRNGGLK